MPSSTAEKVDSLFPGYNCAQTVLKIFASKAGLDETIALKIASGFGSGMASAETCGAVTGSYMVIGLKHGHASTIPEEKAGTKSKIIEFNRKFLAEHGSLKCRELTGYDISTAEGSDAARECGVFREKCPLFIKTACSILEKDF